MTHSDHHPTLGRLLRVALTASITVPLVLLAAIGTALYIDSELAAAKERMRHIASSISGQVGDYLEWHENAVAMVAAAHDSPVDASGRARVEMLRRFTPGVLTSIMAREDGSIVAASPERTADGDKVTEMGADVSDRGYFRQAMATGTSHVSGAFRGRGFGSDPIVAISAPIEGSRGPVGILQGSLDLSRFERFLRDFGHVPDLRISILDDDQTVVFDSSVPGATLRNFVPGDAKVRASSVLVTHGWSVMVEQPVATIIANTLGYLLAALALLILGMALAIGLANLLTRRITRPLGQLAEAANAFDLGRNSSIRLGPRAPRELHHLAERLSAMEERLHHTLDGLIPICAGCKKVRIADDSWQQIEVYVGDRSRARFSHGMCPGCTEYYIGSD